jgi:hypothetical protein
MSKRDYNISRNIFRSVRSGYDRLLWAVKAANVGEFGWPIAGCICLRLAWKD